MVAFSLTIRCLLHWAVLLLRLVQILKTNSHSCQRKLPIFGVHQQQFLLPYRKQVLSNRFGQWGHQELRTWRQRFLVHDQVVHLEVTWLALHHRIGNVRALGIRLWERRHLWLLRWRHERVPVNGHFDYWTELIKWLLIQCLNGSLLGGWLPERG